MRRGELAARPQLRWLAVWALGVALFVAVVGVPRERTQVFAIVIAGVVAAGVGTSGTTRRVLLDWVPFLALLLLYDVLRAAATSWVPPHAVPQIRVDEFLFGGQVPTLTLQHALYTPGVAHVWDYAVFGVYLSHFFVAFVVAGVLWHLDHERFRRFAVVLVALTFAAFVTYALYPAVPPWLAAKQHLIGHTSKIIDHMWATLGVDRGPGLLSARGRFANPVAAIPSLHAAYPMLIALFFWGGARRWRWLLAAYPLAMGFTLVYAGEHYVIDILIGWVYAVVVYLAGSAAYSWWRAGATAAPAPVAEVAVAETAQMS
ncbi:MAG: phosphatase PAP2 family protein [Acidimicrobiia bacterium]